MIKEKKKLRQKRKEKKRYKTKERISTKEGKKRKKEAKISTKEKKNQRKDQAATQMKKETEWQEREKKRIERLRVRLFMEFKNCCLKRCENCSLKSIVEKRVFNGYKTKKCVWYHGLNNMFLVFKKHKNVFGTCVWFKTKADTFDQNKLFFNSKNIFLMPARLCGWDWGDGTAFNVWAGRPYNV